MPVCVGAPGFLLEAVAGAASAGKGPERINGSTEVKIEAVCSALSKSAAAASKQSKTTPPHRIIEQWGRRGSSVGVVTMAEGSGRSI